MLPACLFLICSVLHVLLNTCFPCWRRHDEQRLTCAITQLQDGHILAKYRVCQGVTLHLTARLRGMAERRWEAATALRIASQSASCNAAFGKLLIAWTSPCNSWIWMQ